MTDDEPYFARTVTARSLEEILMAARISPKAKPGKPAQGRAQAGSKARQAPRLSGADPQTTMFKLRHRPGFYERGAFAVFRRRVTKCRLPALVSDPTIIGAATLCHACHMTQHEQGESQFWHRLRIDPVSVAMDLWECRWIEDMRAVIFAAREKRK